ncbi:MAG: ribonuclease P protein component [Oscillospiraceae bacterium]|nr:ribonuclease P protein component [Oscillospiraceae bacterium]
MVFTIKLNQNKDFLRLYQRGAFCSLGSALLYAMPNGRSYNRLGITAGKKVGCAVKRNRAKRIIRAAYTANELSMPIGLDIVFVARHTLPDESSLILTKTLGTRGLKHLQGVSDGSIPCEAQNRPPRGRSAGKQKQTAAPASNATSCGTSSSD